MAASALNSPRATPDGYTLMMASSAFLIRTLLYPSSYHPLKDFAPVTQLVKHPYVMVVASGVPACSVTEFIAWAKANSDRVNYASSGSGSLIHLTGELFKAKTGTAMTHIPYKGISPGLVDMFSGRVQATFASINANSPADFARAMQAEYAGWSAVIRNAHIRGD